MARSDSRQRAIQTAALLFQQYGYAATGVAEIIERSGTPKGSFYFNFPGGKEELGIEALGHAGQQLATGIGRLSAASGSAAEFLGSLAASMAAALEASDYTLGCPIATVALETATVSEPLRRTAEAQFAAWEEAIACGLAAGRRPTRNDRSRAALVLVMLEGALIMSRVRRSTAPLRSLEPALRQLAAGS